MRSIRLPGTQIALSRLSFGTSGLHRLISAGRRQSLLAAAFDAGFTHFDTAPLYGFGLAESELGCFLKMKRDKVTVTTKIGLYPPAVRTSSSSVLAAKMMGRVWRGLAKPKVSWELLTIVTEFENSLRRLQTDVIDLLLLHEPLYRSFQPDALLGWLKNERKRGRLRAWGLAGETARVCEWLENGDELAMVLQVRDSLERGEADQLLAHGRELQLTYGYIAAALKDPGRPSPSDVIQAALAKNCSGSVLISTIDRTHLWQLARGAERERDLVR